jgi:hypothetical protein
LRLITRKLSWHAWIYGPQDNSSIKIIQSQSRNLFDYVSEKSFAKFLGGAAAAEEKSDIAVAYQFNCKRYARMVEAGRASSAKVMQTLRDSLDQLKLSVDALNLPPGDVGVSFDVNAPDRLPLKTGRSVD